MTVSELAAHNTYDEKRVGCARNARGPRYDSEYSVERFCRDVPLLRLYEGTLQLQQLIIARNRLKHYETSRS